MAKAISLPLKGIRVPTQDSISWSVDTVVSHVEPRKRGQPRDDEARKEACAPEDSLSRTILSAQGLLEKHTSILFKQTTVPLGLRPT